MFVVDANVATSALMTPLVPKHYQTIAYGVV